jgi:hypothetical protein
MGAPSHYAQPSLGAPPGLLSVLIIRCVHTQDEELWTNELQVAGGPLEQDGGADTPAAQIVEGVFDKEWEELTKAEAKAAAKLGYTKKSWYESAPPKMVPYSALSAAEKKAAASLGWEEELWENERKAALEESGGGAGDEAAEGGDEEEDDELVEVSGAFDKEWTELSKSEAKAAKRLGYTAITWYENAPPKLVGWDKLSKTQVKAATKLGWVRPHPRPEWSHVLPAIN